MPKENQDNKIKRRVQKRRGGGGGQQHNREDRRQPPTHAPVAGHVENRRRVAERLQAVGGDETVARHDPDHGRPRGGQPGFHVDLLEKQSGD